VLYPGFTSSFFDALKYKTIVKVSYITADLSIRCSGADYNLLRAFAILWFVVGIRFTIDGHSIDLARASQTDKRV
jgi:hypothetical protein